LHWNVALTEAVAAALAFYRPRALVFDGNVPFKGLLGALERHPSVARVWIRRALWRPEHEGEALERSSAFDLVVEPGEVAWIRDDGPTAAQIDRVMRVAPVRLLDQGEIPGRAAACAALGFDPGATNVLIAVGAGNNFDLREIVSRALDRLAGRAGIGVAVAEWRIASEQPPMPPGVVRLEEYPFAAALGAFDFAIAAAGYNTFAEHIAAGLPTIWVPNENPLMDQQIHRAAYARDAGFGACLRRSEPFELGRLVDLFLQPGVRALLGARAAREATRSCAVNGAREIAAELQARVNTIQVRA
jgi:UDP:flavonoid glycosyltransferase YjiC (YdhE family)